ncbi:hypothetical protein GUJ93_ZPchr0001g30491 [Zizania palustris]|uniref:Uncharacterized protein n=1 Tax=Zizania palustris TaxID=103762 RepID=A0A8J5SGB4_ZIZPA|nr:hypothetical protein GUJ93_ZPchr0001g30491 [Zizania palustris]
MDNHQLKPASFAWYQRFYSSAFIFITLLGKIVSIASVGMVKLRQSLGSCLPCHDGVFGCTCENQVQISQCMPTWLSSVVAWGCWPVVAILLREPPAPHARYRGRGGTEHEASRGPWLRAADESARHSA